MRDVNLVVLSHYPDLFDGFRQSIEKYEPGVPKLLVRDGNLIHLPPRKEPFAPWRMTQGVEPFVFARNMNLGWKCSPKSDVVIAGDDVRFVEPFISVLQEVAYSDPKIGFVVPELGGQSCFVCAYIKRDLLNEVGPMDEQFDGYGYEDNDYYRRFEALGWRTMPTTRVRVTHNTGATSFRRRMDEGTFQIGPAADRAREKFNAKWGIV